MCTFKHYLSTLICTVLIKAVFFNALDKCICPFKFQTPFHFPKALSDFKKKNVCQHNNITLNHPFKSPGKHTCLSLEVSHRRISVLFVKFSLTAWIPYCVCQVRYVLPKLREAEKIYLRKLMMDWQPV